jgi:CMP-N,N'-diacetyllegionaminic acid synthase
MKIVALIPARAGSKRIPGKNTKLLGGKPLIQWTIEAAKESGVFQSIWVCTDDPMAASIAIGHRGVGVVHRDPSGDDEPDIAWVRPTLGLVSKIVAFAILRPTSPFRTADTIIRAATKFEAAPCSSIRAVEPVKQHPGKMWQFIDGMSTMKPLIGDVFPPEGYGMRGLCSSTPWHSRPTQSLPVVYAQNSSLEIARTWCVSVFDNISGPRVAPFFTEGWEGFSIDYPEDWDRAEAHAQTLLAAL